tara:strand:- start:5025 stop:5717 length:693 start_codon:yes stop_codon:yes gene_type:complete
MKTFKKQIKKIYGQEDKSNFVKVFKHLELMNSPLIPKLHYYDNNMYEMEYIEGQTFHDWVRENRDYDFCLDVMDEIHKFLIDLSRLEIEDKSTETSEFLSKDVLVADDIHPGNIMIDKKEKKFYIVDLDQFSFRPQNLVFKYIGKAMSRIGDAICHEILHYDYQHVISDLKNQHETFKAKNEKLWPKLPQVYEAGVRHGFWNVKTKKEIKEKYEKYKHEEDWMKDLDEGL